MSTTQERQKPSIYTEWQETVTRLTAEIADDPAAALYGADNYTVVRFYVALNGPTVLIDVWIGEADEVSRIYFCSNEHAPDGEARSYMLQPGELEPMMNLLRAYADAEAERTRYPVDQRRARLMRRAVA